jgi:hypothetical protein
MHMTAQLPDGVSFNALGFLGLGVDDSGSIPAFGIKPVINPEKDDGFSHLV